MGAGPLLGLALLGCGDDASEESPPPEPQAAVVYYRDAKPVIDDKCGSCHRVGGIAPFALTTYEEVAARAAAVKSAVVEGRMPPWPADDACRTYLQARSLNAEQIALLTAFVDQGAVAGDPVEEPPQAATPKGLSRIDVTLSMTEPYAMTTEPDEYRCFVLDWPQAERTYVTGFSAVPGNATVVHHVIAHLAGPEQATEAEALDDADEAAGYACFGGSGIQGSQWLAAWAPGGAGSDFPAGTGIPVDPGSKIVLQVHYNSLTSGPAPDLSQVAFKIDDQVEKEARIQPFTNPAWLVGQSMAIPPATNDVTHSFSTGFLSADRPLRIYSAGLHMHQLGQSARLAIARAPGGEECLLDIPGWDFHWQGSYGFESSTLLEPGDELSLTCVWDNPTMQTVTWGEGTGDEMCLGVVYVTEE